MLKYLLCWQHCLHTHIYQKNLVIPNFCQIPFFPKEALAEETTKQDNDNKNTMYFSVELYFIQFSKNINRD